jgi:hypothetical protein
VLPATHTSVACLLQGLRPITCSSPILPDDPSGLIPNSSSSWQLRSAQHTQHGTNLIRSMRKQQLQQEQSAASLQGAGEHAAGGGTGLASSCSRCVCSVTHALPHSITLSCHTCAHSLLSLSLPCSCSPSRMSPVLAISPVLVLAWPC